VGETCQGFPEGMPVAGKPGRVYEGKVEIEVKKKKGKLLGAGYWVKPARVCGQASREGRPGRVWRKKHGARGMG